MVETARVEIDLLAEDQTITAWVVTGLCFRQPAANAVKSAKFLLSQQETGLFFAGTVSGKMVGLIQEEMRKEVSQGLALKTDLRVQAEVVRVLNTQNSLKL